MLQARHEGEPEQVTQAKDLVGAAVCIDNMGADGQLGIIVEQSVQDIERFALGTRNDLRVEDALLIREVRIHAHDAVIIAKVAGVEGRE